MVSNQANKAAKKKELQNWLNYDPSIEEESFRSATRVPVYLVIFAVIHNGYLCLVMRWGSVLHKDVGEARPSLNNRKKPFLKKTEIRFAVTLLKKKSAQQLPDILLPPKHSPMEKIQEWKKL